MSNSENQKLEINFQLTFLHNEMSNINLFDEVGEINDNYQEEITKYNNKIKTDCEELFYKLLKYQDDEPEIIITISYRKGSYELLFNVTIIVSSIALSNFLIGFSEGIVGVDFHEKGKKCAEQLKKLLQEIYIDGNDETIQNYFKNNKKIENKVLHINKNIVKNNLFILNNIEVSNISVVNMQKNDDKDEMSFNSPM